MAQNKLNVLRGQSLDLIVEALRAAEMRQGCTDYGYYAEILLRQLEPLLFEVCIRRLVEVLVINGKSGYINQQ